VGTFTKNKLRITPLQLRKYIYCFFICLSCFLGHFIEMMINEKVIYVFLFFAFLLFYIDIINKNIKKRIIYNYYVKIILFVSLLLICSIPFWYSFFNIYSYLGIFVAVMTHYYTPNEFKKMLLIVLIINLPFIIYEYFYGKYFFIYNREFFGTAYDGMELYSSLIRTKGLFSGPLTLGIFYLFSILILYKNKIINIIGIIVAFLANARASFLFSILYYLGIFTINIKSKKNFKSFVRLSILCVFVIIIILNTGLITKNATTRIFNAVDFKEESSNLTRVYYWNNAINMYFSEYSIEYIILGNNGLFASKFLNNAESGWLSLLLDNGIMGFCFYFFILMKLIYDAIKNKDYINLLRLLIMFCCMTIATYHLGRVANLLYWFLIFDIKEAFLIKKMKK